MEICECRLAKPKLIFTSGVKSFTSPSPTTVIKCMEPSYSQRRVLGSWHRPCFFIVAMDI